jgi:hypothetical protein
MSTRISNIGLVRTAKHDYYFDGIGPLPGVTGAIGVIDKSGPLVGWAKRITAEFVMDNLEWVNTSSQLIGRDATVDAIKSRAQSVKDDAGKLGSAVHVLAEQIARGEDTGTIPTAQIPYAIAYRRFLEECQPTFISMEKAVISLTHGYGGTFDALMEIDGVRTLVDYKTSKGSTYKGIYTGVYPETALQLAAYANADFTALEGDSRRYKPPTADQYAVLHIRPDAPYEKGYRLIRYDIGEREFAAFLNALHLTKWRRERESQVVGAPIDSAVARAAVTGAEGATALPSSVPVTEAA